MCRRALTIRTIFEQTKTYISLAPTMIVKAYGKQPVQRQFGAMGVEQGFVLR